MGENERALSRAEEQPEVEDLLLAHQLEEAGYRFLVYAPKNVNQPQQFTVCVYAMDGSFLRSALVPLSHDPIFGFDEEDLAALDVEVDELIEALPTVVE